MKILAFEAATRRISVALWQAGRVAEKAADIPNGGSELLLPWAMELLAAAGSGLRQLDALAFGAGPGGFTGLRLACGVAQGLAYGLDRPLVPVNTLAALALGTGDGKILTCLDARMNEVYFAGYAVHGDQVDEVLAPAVCSAASVTVPDGPGWRGVGDGFAVWGEVLHTRLGDRLLTVEQDRQPSAASVARLAHTELARGGDFPVTAAAPLYVRDKVALTTAERLARGGLR